MFVPEREGQRLSMIDPTGQEVIQPGIDLPGKDAVIPRRSDLEPENGQRDRHLHHQGRQPIGVAEGEMTAGEDHERHGPRQFQSAPNEEDIAKEEEMPQRHRNDPPERKRFISQPDGQDGAEQQHDAVQGRHPETMLSSWERVFHVLKPPRDVHTSHDPPR